MTLKPEQQRVYDWLDSKVEWKGGQGLPVFAEVYKGALHLLETKSPGYITFVAHAGRDLMNILSRTVAGIERPQVQYHQRLDRLQLVWKEEWGGQGLSTHDNGGNGHLIPYNICNIVKELVDGHKAVRETSNQIDVLFFTNFLDYDFYEQIPKNFLDEWEKAREWFVGYAHLRAPRFSEDVPSKVERHFETLDSLLRVAASSEFERLRSIDEILEETNG